MAGVVRSAGIVLLRSSEILRSIRESVAPRGVASIDPPDYLARSTSLSLPLASPLALPAFSLCFACTPLPPFSLRAFFSFASRPRSLSLASTDSSFLSQLIRPSPSLPFVPLPFFFLSLVRFIFLRSSPRLRSSSSFVLLSYAWFSLSLCLFASNQRLSLSLSSFSTPRSMPRSPAAPCFRSYRRGSCSSSSFLLLLPPPRSPSPSRSRPLSVSFLRFFRPGSTTDDVRLLCDGVADASPRRPLERRSIAEADAFLSSNHAESADSAKFRGSHRSTRWKSCEIEIKGEAGKKGNAAMLMMAERARAYFLLGDAVPYCHWERLLPTALSISWECFVIRIDNARGGTRVAPTVRSYLREILGLGLSPSSF